MAKLNARGRTVISAVTKADGGYLYIKRLMSDRAVLVKTICLDCDGKRQDWGWKRAGKLIPGTTPVAWLTDMMSLGWRIE